MNTNEAKALRKIIENYATAMVADSWKGSEDPDDYEILCKNFADAKEDLEQYLKTLIQ